MRIYKCDCWNIVIAVYVAAWVEKMNKTDEKFYKRVKIIDYCRAWIAYLILQYELITCVCMFEPWERIFINGLVLTLFSLVTYSSVVYLPKYLLSLFTYFGQMIEMLQLPFNLS